jgi:hypothetical protein
MTKLQLTQMISKKKAENIRGKSALEVERVPHIDKRLRNQNLHQFTQGLINATSSP